MSHFLLARCIIQRDQEEIKPYWEYFWAVLHYRLYALHDTTVTSRSALGVAADKFQFKLEGAAETRLAGRTDSTFKPQTAQKIHTHGQIHVVINWLNVYIESSDASLIGLNDMFKWERKATKRINQINQNEEISLHVNCVARIQLKFRASFLICIAGKTNHVSLELTK